MAEPQRTNQVRRDGSGLQAGACWARAVRLLGAVIVLLGFTAMVTAGAAQAGQPRTAAGSGWKVEPTPNQNRDSGGINELSAVSCTSGRACTAGRLARGQRVQPVVHPGGEVERHALADSAHHPSQRRREQCLWRRVLPLSD